MVGAPPAIMVPHAPRGTAGDGPGLVVITARIHSRARLSSFSRSSGVSACSANLTQSRANSSNSFFDPDDMSAPTHRPPFDPANAVHRVKFHRIRRRLLTIGAVAGPNRCPFQSEGHKQTPVAEFIRDRHPHVRSTAGLLYALRHLGRAH